MVSLDVFRGVFQHSLWDNAMGFLLSILPCLWNTTPFTMYFFYFIFYKITIQLGIVCLYNREIFMFTEYSILQYRLKIGIL
jgi:hypothetical protein